MITHTPRCATPTACALKDARPNQSVRVDMCSGVIPEADASPAEDR